MRLPRLRRSCRAPYFCTAGFFLSSPIVGARSLWSSRSALAFSNPVCSVGAGVRGAVIRGTRQLATRPSFNSRRRFRVRAPQKSPAAAGTKQSMHAHAHTQDTQAHAPSGFFTCRCMRARTRTHP
jgi:hypothetical protein